MKSLGIVAGVAALLAAASVHATVIDFEDQPAGPCCFASAGPAQTLNYNLGGGLTATFTGGVILTGESNQTTDNSNVYATASPTVIGGADPTLANPLVITFNAPIHNFQVDVLNALAGNYELYDNAGHTDFFSLATSGGSIQTVGFAATGTVVDIVYLDAPTAWDFAIDNVTFNQPLSNVPEPATWTMLILGLAMVGFAAHRRSRGTRSAV